MSADHAVLGGRLDASARTLGVAVGDVVVIGLLIVAGEIRHWGSDWVVANPGAVAETALPFYVGWVLAAVAVGAYAASTFSTPKRAILVPAAAWVVAATIGALLRGTGLFSGNFALTFLAVMIGFGLLAITPWRIVATLASQRLDRRTAT